MKNGLSIHGLENLDMNDEFADVRKRYAAERDRRMQDGANRYIDLEGRYAKMVADPYVDPAAQRDPISRDVDVLILGGGFSGLLTAANLRRSKVDDFLIIDKAGDFGGTWYWNRYPGVMCDVESYIYLPLIEEIGTIPSMRYAPGHEILEHSRAIGRHFDLYPKALFQTQVASLKWEEDRRRWRVETDCNDVIHARFVVLGSGPLNAPRLPEIPGINSYTGHMFHTCRWDYDFTGGSPTTPMDKLADKRIAIIGTGATGVQVVPELAKAAKELIVVQRTPSAVGVRDNAPTDVSWFRNQKPGWQRRRMENFDAILAGIPQTENLVGDKWSDIWSPEPLLLEGEDASVMSMDEVYELTDFRRMERMRQRIDNVVKNPDTAADLKPFYGRFCKRPCFHDDYLEAFNRENVTLVDTQGRGVTRITSTGLEIAGKHYEVDGIVFATGFDFAARADRSGGFTLNGVGGRTLAEKWDHEFRSLHGMFTRDFPNLFVIGTLRQSAGTINIPYSFGDQAEHAAETIAELLRSGVTRMEVSQAAEDAWTAQCNQKSRRDLAYLSKCTPGVYNGEGHTENLSLLVDPYGGGPLEYAQLIRDWRTNGGMTRDLDLA
ncbi:MAG: NAD(P)/FAD-dependent oxidoreductase [Novosphingobium sp.]